MATANIMEPTPSDLPPAMLRYIKQELATQSDTANDREIEKMVQNLIAQAMGAHSSWETRGYRQLILFFFFVLGAFG